MGERVEVDAGQAHRVTLGRVTEQPGVDSDGKRVYPLDRIWEFIGFDHWIDRYSWGGVEVGVHILHKNAVTGRWCMSGVNYDTPEVAAHDIPPNKRWQLHSLEPLHVEPSILCNAPSGPDGAKCADHGFIRDGRWEGAP